MSSLGLGTRLWGSGVDEEVARDLVTAFVEAGGTLLDSSPSYGHGAAESWLGSFVGSVAARADLTLMTRVGVVRRGEHTVVDGSRAAVLSGLEESLRRLRTDYVDLLLTQAWDPHVPIEETLEALEYAVRSGKARYVGVGNHAGWQLARAATLQEGRRMPLVAASTEYSLVDRLAELELLPAAQSLGVGVIAWGRLAVGCSPGSTAAHHRWRHPVAQVFRPAISIRTHSESPTRWSPRHGECRSARPRWRWHGRETLPESRPSSWALGPSRMCARRLPARASCCPPRSERR